MDPLHAQAFETLDKFEENCLRQNLLFEATWPHLMSLFFNIWVLMLDTGQFQTQIMDKENIKAHIKVRHLKS